MGCVASRIDKDERVQVCRQRKRLMKQLLEFRGQFADAQLAYLRALKNTGVTLRQFTESESLELENTPPYGLAMPPSPPSPLPPSPPPPPPFSPDVRKLDDDRKGEAARVEIMEISENGSNTPPPPLVPSSSWDWYPFPTTPEQLPMKSESLDQVEDEDWAETKSEFEDEYREEESVSTTLEQPAQLIDDNSSVMSCYTKDTADMAMVVWRSKKNLDSIIKELDDYFLKASAVGKEIAVLMDINKGDNFPPHTFKERKSKCMLILSM